MKSFSARPFLSSPRTRWVTALVGVLVTSALLVALVPSIPRYAARLVRVVSSSDRPWEAFVGFFVPPNIKTDVQLFPSLQIDQEPPLQKYAITRAKNSVAGSASPLMVKKELRHNDDSTSYLFSFTTQGKLMSGLIVLPKNVTNEKPLPTVILVRGYVPPTGYWTGLGSRKAAEVFAAQGYIAVSPDFLGYGESDPDYENNWESRLVKPVQVADLITSLTTQPIDVSQVMRFPLPATTVGLASEEVTQAATQLTVDPTQLAIWAHSNGGQIALTMLEETSWKIPTSLWAPVTTPFPYSVLFFGDEVEDEGRAMRQDIALFEKTYDVFDFSLTKHLDLLHAPLQLHQGAADTAIHPVWQDEFVDRILAENVRRKAARSNPKPSLTPSLSPSLPSPSPSTPLDLTKLMPIEQELFHYPGADHNLNPGWETAMQRTLSFYSDNWPLTDPVAPAVSAETDSSPQATPATRLDAAP